MYGLALLSNKPGGTAVSTLSASALIWSFFQQHSSPWHISIACRLFLLQKEVL